MKWIASIMILIGATGFGYSEIEEEKEKLQLLMQQDKLICLLQGEIEHFHRRLSDAFLCVSKKVKIPYGVLLEKVSERMKQWKGEDLQTIWREELQGIEQQFHINSELHKALYKLVENINYEEYTMQMKALGYVREEIEREITGRREKLEQNQTWMIGFCSLLGVLCVIVLL